MNREAEIKKILYDYETGGLIDGDPVKVLSLLSDDVIGIGIGEQGFVSSKAEVRAIITDTVRKDPAATYSLKYENIMIHFPTETAASLCAKVTVLRTAGGVTTTSGFMQSLMFTRRDGVWLICQLHASPVMLSSESIEAYPLSFADSTLANLRNELQTDTFDLINKSFSGGVFGTYIADSFPLYFANDTLIEQMGYTRDEFTEAYSENATEMVYEADRDRIVTEVSVALEQGQTEYVLRFRMNTKGGGFFWVIEHARKVEDANGVPVMLGVTTDITQMVELQEKLEAQHATILSSIRYASKIQRNLLPTESSLTAAFADHAAIWRPKDVVGGDIYWLRSFALGTVLVVCDCTGHGTPGALLTVLVSTTLDALVDEKSCGQPALIMAELDAHVAGVLGSRDPLQTGQESDVTDIRDGCDMAVFFVANDGAVVFASSGVQVFSCDGDKVTRFKAQHLNIGAGALSDPSTVRLTTVPHCPGQKFYVASDGLYDQIGGEEEHSFGYHPVRDIILEHHAQPMSEIAKKLWQAFELHKGENTMRDDVELIAFMP